MRSLVLIFIGSVLLCSCQQKDTGSCGEEICTTEFVSLSVILKDSLGNNYIPEKVETYNTAGTMLHQSTTPLIPSENAYTIIDDGDKNEITKLSFNTLAFKIYKNSTVVQTDTFIVSSDCCHVFMQSGYKTIIVK